MPILKKKSSKKEASPLQKPSKPQKPPKPYALDNQKKKEYKTKGVMGIGTYGVVREAVHIPTGRTVALKIIKKHIIKEHHKEGMVERELNILKKIKHPHIVEFIDFFETKSKYYIVFELATGGELFDRICQKGKFTEKDAAIIITTVIGAVSFLHARGIVHRDIKPENLLYRDKSVNADLLLCDFGISKMIESPEEMLTTVCGSPGYTAPEILKHEPYSKPVDMWSIGVITYTLLCGYSPFHYADDLNQLYNAICHGRYTFDNIYWAYISRYAKDFIKSLLQVQPEKRLTADEALQHTWLVKLCPAQIERIKNINGIPVPSNSTLKRPIKSYSTSATQGTTYSDPIKQSNSRVKPYVKSKYLITDESNIPYDILHQNSYISFHNTSTLSPDSDNDHDAISYPGAGALQNHATVDVSHYMNINSQATLVNKSSNISDKSTATSITSTTPTGYSITPSSENKDNINHINNNNINNSNNTIIENSNSIKITSSNNHNNSLTVKSKPSKDQYLSPASNYSNISDTSSTIVQSNSITSNTSVTYSDSTTIGSYVGNNSYTSPNRLSFVIKEEKYDSSSQLSPESILTNCSKSDMLSSNIVASPKSEYAHLSPELGEHSPSLTVHSAPISQNYSKCSYPNNNSNLNSSPSYSPNSNSTKSKKQSKENLHVRKQSSNRGEKFFNHLFKRKSHSSINLSQKVEENEENNHNHDNKNNVDDVIPPRKDSKNQTINKHTWKTLLKSSKQGNKLFRKSKESLKNSLRSYQKSKSTAIKSLNDLDHLNQDQDQDGESYDYSTLTDASSIGLSSVTSDISRKSSCKSTINENKGSTVQKTTQPKAYTRKSFSTSATSSLTSLIKNYQSLHDIDNNYLTIPNMEYIEKNINTFENNEKLKKITSEPEDSQIGKHKENQSKKTSLESFPPYKEKNNDKSINNKNKRISESSNGSKEKLNVNKSKSNKSKGKLPDHPPWNDISDDESYDYVDEMDILYTMKLENEILKKKNNKKKNIKSRSKIIFSGSEGWYPEEPVVSLVKENGEIKGYYAPGGEKYTGINSEGNSIDSRINHNSIKNYNDKKSSFNVKNDVIVNPSKRPIPSIILTERTETNSSTSSLIPGPSIHPIKDFFSKRTHIVEEDDELNTDISDADDNEDYDDLDIPLVKNNNYKSSSNSNSNSNLNICSNSNTNPLSSTPLDNVIIGPKELEKIDIKDDIALKTETKQKQDEKPKLKIVSKSTPTSPKLASSSSSISLSSMPRHEIINRKSTVIQRKPLKTKESYDLIEDFVVSPIIHSAPSFISSKPINIKFDKNKDYNNHHNQSRNNNTPSPTLSPSASPHITIQPSTPVTQEAAINAVATLTKNDSSRSSLETSLSSTITPTNNSLDVGTVSPSSNTSFTVLSHRNTNNTKKLCTVGRRGAFYDHNNDPDLLSVSIPSNLSQSFSSTGSESYPSSTNSPILSTFNYQSFNNISNSNCNTNSNMNPNSNSDILHFSPLTKCSTPNSNIALSVTTENPNEIPVQSNTITSTSYSTPSLNPNHTKNINNNINNCNNDHNANSMNINIINNNNNSTSNDNNINGTNNTFLSNNNNNNNSITRRSAVKGLTIGTAMYVEPDQISTSMSSSGEEDFEEDIYHYKFTPTYDIEEEEDNDDDDGINDDNSSIPILPDEQYIANFSANGVKPQIPSFELEDDEDDEFKVQGKRARAKSDSRYDDNRDIGVNRIEEEGDGLLHPNDYGSSHKRINSTGACINMDKKLEDENCYNDDDLEMPNLLSQDLYSKVLRKKFQRAVRIINIVRRLSSKSSFSSSTYSYNNSNDISDTSSLYSNVNSFTKLDPKKKTLSVEQHSRNSSISSSLSNVISPTINSEDLILTPSVKENISPSTPLKSDLSVSHSNSISKSPILNSSLSPILIESKISLNEEITKDKEKASMKISINEEQKKKEEEKKEMKKGKEEDILQKNIKE